MHSKQKWCACILIIVARRSTPLQIIDLVRSYPPVLLIFIYISISSSLRYPIHPQPQKAVIRGNESIYPIRPPQNIPSSTHTITRCTVETRCGTGGLNSRIMGCPDKMKDLRHNGEDGERWAECMCLCSSLLFLLKEVRSCFFSILHLHLPFYSCWYNSLTQISSLIPFNTASHKVLLSSLDDQVWTLLSEILSCYNLLELSGLWPSSC